MTEQTPDSNESFKIIEEMIHQAKSSVNADSFYYLFWGWVVCLTSFAHYLLLTFTTYDKPHIVWLIVIPGILVSVFYSYKEYRNKPVKTHIGKVSGLVWLGFLFNYIIIMIFKAEINYQITPLIFMIAATTVFFSGILLKEKILIISSIMLWISAFVCFMVDYQTQLLINTIATFAGYLVPGYLLKYKFRKENV